MKEVEQLIVQGKGWNNFLMLNLKVIREGPVPIESRMRTSILKMLLKYKILYKHSRMFLLIIR